ncbi:unnamed protein product [Caenorhabditis brenneri]
MSPSVSPSTFTRRPLTSPETTFHSTCLSVSMRERSFSTLSPTESGEKKSASRTQSRREIPSISASVLMMIASRSSLTTRSSRITSTVSHFLRSPISLSMEIST